MHKFTLKLVVIIKGAFETIANNTLYRMAVCGPKLSIFLILIGIWAIVMLGIMGLFFRIRSPALSPDITWPETDANTTNAQLEEKVGKAYDQSSNNCFIAAGIYGVVVVASAINYKCLNMRGNLQ